MAGNILSPISIWADFVVPKKPSYLLLDSKTENGFVFNKYLVDGRQTDKGIVKIYIKTIQKSNKNVTSAVVFLKEFDHPNVENSLFSLAELGYLAVFVDIEGESEKQSDEHTVYPEDICYANYINAKLILGKIEESVKLSPYYEWCAVLKYSYSFIKSIEDIERIGAIGYGKVATPLWQSAMNEKELSSLVVIRNAGWQSYKGNYKYDEQLESQFDDDTLVYIAGVEPQSYAQYVQCPTFIIANPNESEYEPDRAHDTLKRVDNEKKGIFYENRVLKGLSNQSVETVKAFLDQTLNGDKRSFRICEPLISSKKENGKCIVKIEAIDKNVESVRLFASEEEMNPQSRCYVEVTDCEVKGKTYTFTYTPYCKSSRVMFFATEKNENGISISSNIEVVEFTEEEICSSCKSPIIYSGRIAKRESIFLSKDAIKYENMFENKKLLQVETGSQGIKGLSSQGGIITFSIKSLKFRPEIDNFLMFDLFAKCDSEIVLSAYTNYYGERKQYSTIIKLNGVNAWQNQKIELSKLKTIEGRPLKEIDNLDALEFYSKENVLVNNLLWV